MPTMAFPFCFTKSTQGIVATPGIAATPGIVLGVCLLFNGIARGATKEPPAFAASDSLLCKLPYAPGADETSSPTPRPRLVLVEGVSATHPLVSFYGHQTLVLAKLANQKEPKGVVSPMQLDAPHSKYLFTLDPERMRLVVALKTKQNNEGREPRPGEGVAGNCQRL